MVADDGAQIATFEAKAVDIYVEILKNSQSTSAILITGLAAYYQFSSFSLSKWTYASFTFYGASIILSTFGLIYLIRPLWHGEIDLAARFPRVIFATTVLTFFGGLLSSILALLL